jgi:hypothetical protein
MEARERYVRERGMDKLACRLTREAVLALRSSAAVYGAAGVENGRSGSASSSSVVFLV